MTCIIDTITTRLESGDNPFDVARDAGCATAKLSELDHESTTPLDDDLVAVILPDYSADDGNAQIDDIVADGPQEAADQYVEGGAWGDGTETVWISVWVWRTGYVLDPDTGEVEAIRIDQEKCSVTLEPEEPECSADDHDWQSPHSVVGGIEKNPGVWGKGGGVVITEVCRHCGAYRVTDTWAQDMSTGEQGLTSVEYREPDESSLEWIEALKGEESE